MRNRLPLVFQIIEEVILMLSLTHPVLIEGFSPLYLTSFNTTLCVAL